jgi:hypothetical protein
MAFMARRTATRRALKRTYEVSGGMRLSKSYGLLPKAEGGRTGRQLDIRSKGENVGGKIRRMLGFWRI